MFRKVFPKEQKGKTSQEGPDNQAAPGITQPATQHPISHQPLSSTGPSGLSTRPTTIKKFPRSSIRILGHRKTVTVPPHLNILRESYAAASAALVDARQDRGSGITTLRHSTSREDR